MHIARMWFISVWSCTESKSCWTKGSYLQGHATDPVLAASANFVKSAISGRLKQRLFRLETFIKHYIFMNFLGGITPDPPCYCILHLTLSWCVLLQLTCFFLCLCGHGLVPLQLDKWGSTVPIYGNCVQTLPLPTNFRMTHLVVVLQIHEWDLPQWYCQHSLVTRLVSSMMVVWDLHPPATAALQLSVYLH